MTRLIWMIKMSVLPGFVILAAFMAPTLAGAEVAEPHNGAVLCQPGVYTQAPQDCLPSGPSGYLTQMAESGIRFPIQPLPASKPAPDLVYVPYLYARVVSDGTPVFASLDDAARGDPAVSWIEPGFDFITYIDRTEVNGAWYFMLENGSWVRGGDLSRISAMPSFQGLRVYQTPKIQFGWVLFETESKHTPGYPGNDYTGRIYYRYHLVQIYDTQEIDGQPWVRISPDEWLEGRMVASVTPNPTPPDGVENGRWVEINLAEQTIAVYDDQQMVFASVMSSGVSGQWTQPGLFQAYKKKPTETMSGSFTADRSDYYYLEDVPWTIYFDQARALHGTYWHNSFGIPTSRGCVNLSTGDAQWIFNWIEEGDWVYVWDPSGLTPTDPSLYSSGGA